MRETTAELQQRFNVTKLTNDTIANSTDNARITMQLFETTDPEAERKLNEQNETISHHIGTEVGEIEQSLSSVQERELFEVVTQNRTAYVTARQKAKKLLADKKRDQAMAALTGEVIPALTVYRASWVKFIDLQSDAVQRSMRQSAEAYNKSRQLALLVFVLTLILATIGAIGVTRTITVPIQHAVEHAEAIASGDLSRPIDVTNESETGKLLKSMYDMSTKLSTIISDVREGSSAVAAAAAQVSASSQSLSQGTSEQAASVEETSASLEQMNASITQNAENSRKVEQVAEKGARSRGKWRSRAGDCGGHETNCRQDLRHRRHCLQNESSRPQCRYRSGACRRSRQRVCGGCGGSQETSGAQPGGGERNQ